MKKALVASAIFITLIFSTCLYFSIQITSPNANKIKKSPTESIANLAHFESYTKLSMEYDNQTFSGITVFPKNMDENCNVLAIHGYKSNHIDILQYAPLFLEKGCKVWAFDLPSHGLSKGNTLTWGKYELPYLKTLITWITQKHASNKSLTLFGVSLGGALSLQLHHHPNVNKIISDSSYSSANKIFLHQGIKRYGEVAKLLLVPSIFLTELYTGINFEELSPKNVISKIEKPTLIIHSNSDDYTPVSHAKDLQRVANKNSNVAFYFTNWGASHGKSYHSKTSEYNKRLHRFLMSN
jgi:pimeloyl-ACP methyl ester carboxylesterase